jgi:hypothetical protein
VQLAVQLAVPCRFFFPSGRAKAGAKNTRSPPGARARPEFFSSDDSQFVYMDRLWFELGVFGSGSMRSIDFSRAAQGRRRRPTRKYGRRGSSAVLLVHRKKQKCLLAIQPAGLCTAGIVK